MARPEAPHADTAPPEPGPVPPVPPPDDRSGGPTDAGELKRLREELSALHAKLDTR
jgi:hypothetical protein